MSKQNHSFSEDRTFDFIVYLVDALAFLHENNIIHRDIRPAYILYYSQNFQLKNRMIFFLFQGTFSCARIESN
jgi:serine/threonine protein kinase